LARIAQVERALDPDAAFGEAVAAQVALGLFLQAREQRVHLVRRKLRQRRHPRLHVVVLDIRHQQTDRRIHPGIERHDDPRHAEIARHSAGVQRARPAERQQHEVA
jgi:hypothetical protein